MHLGLPLSGLGLRGEHSSQSVALGRQQGQLAIGALEQLVVQDDPLIQATSACLGRWRVEVVVSLVVRIDDQLGTEGEVV
jgi:hypothetical protein